MWIKVSNLFINTDNIVDVLKWGGDQVSIRTTAPEGDVANEDGTGSVHPYEIRLQEEDAEAFIRWLETQALDLTSETEEAEQYRYYREAGGEMLFSEWLSVYKLHKQHIESGRISPYEGELLL